MGYGIQSVSSGGGAGTTYTDKTLAQIEALSPVLYDVGLPTDSPYELRCEVAGTWSYYWRGEPVTKPDLTSFAWVLQTNGSASQARGTVVVTDPGSGAADDYEFYGRAVAATPWTITAVLRSLTPTKDFTSQFGVILYRSTGGKFVSHLSGGSKWANRTTYSGSSYAGISTVRSEGLALEIELRDNGTNVRFRARAFGSSTWTTVYDLAYAAHYLGGAPTHWGFGVNAYNSTTPNAPSVVEVISVTVA